ncbi:MAG: DUF1572 family protein [Chitinophagaceae bacterium]|nr:DUF1572 family protein [Chitinophagaceae bacterium]
MKLTELFIKEIEREAPNTVKMLERVPESNFNWRPHDRSMSIKELASHIVGLASRPGLIVNTRYLDFAENKTKKPEIHTTKDLIREFEEGTKKSIEALRKAKDEDLKENWIMRNGHHIILDMPKEDAIRHNGMNHVYHHRAQLGVFFRLLNIPVPGMYGASADDKIHAAMNN